MPKWLCPSCCKNNCYHGFCAHPQCQSKPAECPSCCKDGCKLPECALPKCKPKPVEVPKQWCPSCCKDRCNWFSLCARCHAKPVECPSCCKDGCQLPECALPKCKPKPVEVPKLWCPSCCKAIPPCWHGNCGHPQCR